ncbi:hypothetical protein OSTOST_22886, partial [Ostertagia ostertagi]
VFWHSKSSVQDMSQLRQIRSDLLIEHGEKSTGRAVIREISYDRKLDRALRDTFLWKLIRRFHTNTLYPEEENLRNLFGDGYDPHPGGAAGECRVWIMEKSVHCARHESNSKRNVIHNVRHYGTVWQSYLDDLEDRSPRTTWKETWLLPAYLLNSGSAYDHLQYLREYEESSDFDDILDYLVIRTVPKERELKDIFRGFGCKSYHDRMRSICQEFNVMEYLQQYSDEQAMTITELELQEKLVAFRQLAKAYSRHRVLNIVIDASLWNNKFRAETVHPVMRNTLDAVYGTTLYGKTHLAYQKSLVYVPDQSGTTYWDGQDGGIEG